MGDGVRMYAGIGQLWGFVVYLLPTPSPTQSYLEYGGLRKSKVTQPRRLAKVCYGTIDLRWSLVFS